MKKNQLVQHASQNANFQKEVGEQMNHKNTYSGKEKKKNHKI